MTRRFPAADRATRYRRSSLVECSRSSPSIPTGSKKAVAASSNAIPCLASLVAAFFSSHSKTTYVYTKYSRSAISIPACAYHRLRSSRRVPFKRSFQCNNIDAKPPLERCDLSAIAALHHSPWLTGYSHSIAGGVANGARDRSNAIPDLNTRPANGCSQALRRIPHGLFTLIISSAAFPLPARAFATLYSLTPKF